MADPDHSRDFVVYLTAESGLTYLTNVSWIRMVDLLSRSPMTISEITRATELPRSTVQSGLSRMVERGLLTCGRSGDDARKVLYRATAVPVIRSMDPNEEMEGLRQWAIKNLVERKGLPTYDTMFILVAELLSRGIDMRPVFTEVGYTMGVLYSSDRGRDRSESLEDAVMRLFELDAPVSIGVSDERVWIRAGPMADSAPTHLMMGFIQAVIQTDMGLVLSSTLEVDGPHGGRCPYLESKVCFRAGPEMGPRLIRRWDEDSYRSARPFCIYMTGRGAVLVSGEAMNSVLSALSSKESAMSEIAARTGLSPVTVNSILSRLEASDMVMSRRSFGATVYTSSSMMLISFPSRVVYSGPTREDTVFPRDSVRFRYMIYQCMMWMVNQFGFGSIALSSVIGAVIARDALAMYPMDGAQEFLETVCRVHRARGVDMRLESYIPLVLSYHPYSETPETIRSMAAYLQSLVEEGVRLTTGQLYPVRMDIVLDHQDEGLR